MLWCTKNLRRSNQMNRGESDVSDVDLIDARIMDETSAVDWDSVTEGEAASFGLALGLYRDQAHVQEKRHTAAGTATGGAISISVMALVGSLFNLPMGTVVIAIVASQMLRALVLCYNERKSRKDAKLMEDQALDVAKRLAALHPAR